MTDNLVSAAVTAEPTDTDTKDSRTLWLDILQHPQGMLDQDDNHNELPRAA